MSEAIRDLVQGVVDGSLSDDELTDWLRDVYDEGLTEPETIALTETMRDSGDILDWDSEISRLIVD